MKTKRISQKSDHIKVSKSNLNYSTSISTHEDENQFNLDRSFIVSSNFTGKIDFTLNVGREKKRIDNLIRNYKK